ncbi:MAG: Ku protein [Verrucomicrobiales bacterium]|nr:Ku protein [Verrucomicrobiales bacterium]
MRPIWKGSVSFGLVNIPITLFPATKREELKFHQLRDSDLSPINYKRVAEADGKEVPWENIVKGYEYEKGKYVVLKPEDFERVDIEATQSVVIQAFVSLDEVNPLLFYKPYFMEPQKGADHAYVLLREALEASGKIGISKVVIKTREYLAAVKPQGDGLMLELMHFAEELLELSEFRVPRQTTAGRREMAMAKDLIASMTEKWDPDAWKDEYHEDLEKMVQEKIKQGDKRPAAKAKARPATKIIDLLSVLQESLKTGKSPQKTPDKKVAAKKTKAKTAAKRKAG